MSELTSHRRSHRRATVWRVRRYTDDGQVKSTRMFAQRAAAQERARRWLAIPTTTRVTVERSVRPVTFDPVDTFEPPPLPPQEAPR